MKNRRPLADILRARAVDPSMLVPQTLAHCAEHPLVALSLARTVEACLPGARRFPHVALVGPADSGKRAIAHAVARELVQPVLELDLGCASGSSDLHAVFKEAADGTVVLVHGLEHAPPPALRDLARAASGTRLDTGSAAAAANALPGFDDFERAMRRSGRGSRRYAAFTIIATARATIDFGAPHLAWVDRTLYVERTAVTEAVRMRRVLGRMGLLVADAHLEAYAGACVNFAVRTLTGLSVLVEWMQAEGLTAVDASVPAERLFGLLGPLANPEHVQRQLEAVAALKAAEAAVTPAAPAPADPQAQARRSGLILP